MSLLDELKTAAMIAEKASGESCALCYLILASDSEEERELLGGRRIGQEALARILRGNGHTIGWRVIARHRREGHNPS
jgi:hypothetical protein